MPCLECGKPESIKLVSHIYLIESCIDGHKRGKVRLNVNPLLLEKLQNESLYENMEETSHETN